MPTLNQKLKSLPTSPGVYIFRGKDGKILYVGKATSLKDRVGSYFNLARGSRPIEMMIHEVWDIEIKKTDTVLEAYILEQNLIKEIQPKYNVDGKDGKSFAYVLITNEEFPGFVILRKKEIEQIFNFQFPISSKFSVSQFSKEFKIKNLKFKIGAAYGPYTSKKQIEIALKILRKIFPYHAKPQKTEKGCLDFQIGLCPGPYDGNISKEDYLKNIRGIRMILEGKKKSLLNKMRKEMEEYSKQEEFEKAAGVRNKIFALQHIQDVALISDQGSSTPTMGVELPLRIEGYDISNISGSYAVGSMVVFDNSGGELGANKSQYRKFRIKTIEGANDIGAMAEVIRRRINNNWPLPNLMLLDGGKGHLNAIRKILKAYRLEIPLLAVAKGPTRKKLDLYKFGNVPEISENILEQIRDEAHRFAITYHRKVRKGGILD